jgi:hypothetical protein
VSAALAGAMSQGAPPNLESFGPIECEADQGWLPDVKQTVPPSPDLSGAETEWSRSRRALEIKECPKMALSDQLMDLAAKAKQVEASVAAAKQKSEAELEADVKSARESSQARADALHKRAEDLKGKISAWWYNVQRTWHEHVTTIREGIDERRAEHDLKAAQRAAVGADEDASFAIDFAEAAIEEARYAVLHAELAHRHADELAKAKA